MCIAPRDDCPVWDNIPCVFRILYSGGDPIIYGILFMDLVHRARESVLGIFEMSAAGPLGVFTEGISGFPDYLYILCL